MKWTNKANKEQANETRTARLSRPMDIPEVLQKQLQVKWSLDPEWTKFLKMATRPNGKGPKVQDFRIFDDSDAIARKIQVKDYTSLDEHPTVILYSGWFDEATKQCEIEEVNKPVSEINFFTQEEISRKIEALSQPGETIFFYVARGGAHGGPLGMGVAIVELNPNYPGKRQKKFNLYVADVVDMQPVDKGMKLFDHDKAEKFADWIGYCHHKRMFSS